MVDILADPEMVGFKRIKHIYQIMEPVAPIEMKGSEDYRVPYKSSKAGCL